MKMMWFTVIWFICWLWVGSSWGVTLGNAKAEVNHKTLMPWIHLVRIKDPIGVQGFDLACSSEEKGQDEPYCEIALIEPRKAPKKIAISYDRAKSMAKGFLTRMPKKGITDAKEEKKVNPPVNDVLLLWRVKLGNKVSNGYVKRSPKDLGVDNKTLRAVLLLESDLWDEKT